ncbi:MAG: T9SS type A sorting domain-containing protein [Bacteroidota bacterium]
MRLVSDIGLVSFAGDASSGQSITYARIADVEYGTATLADLTSVSTEDDATPRALTLSAYPNPLVQTASLQVALPVATTMTLEAFDLLGRRLQTQSATRAAGDHTLVLDATAWAPGTYIVRLQTADGAIRTARLTKR